MAKTIKKDGTYDGRKNDGGDRQKENLFIPKRPNSKWNGH